MNFSRFPEIHRTNSSVDTVTTDGSDIERRIRAYQDQVQKKKNELDHLKQRKNKEALRRQEEELKKQLEVSEQSFHMKYTFFSFSSHTIIKLKLYVLNQSHQKQLLLYANHH